MFPGKFEVCVASGEPEAALYRCLSFGYESEAAALEAAPAVAKKAMVDLEDVVIVSATFYFDVVARAKKPAS